jgi:AcrR family transcriptional regulator
LSPRDGRRNEIVTAARQILEEGGRDALTMRSLAAALGIKAPSLYKHVRDRHEIEMMLSERALEEIGEALAAAGEDLVSLGLAYRKWAKANPGLYRLATSVPLDRAAIAEGVEQAAEAPLLDLFGRDRDLARVCWAMVHGLVDLELNDRFPPGADLDAAWRAGLERMAG